MKSIFPIILNLKKSNTTQNNTRVTQGDGSPVLKSKQMCVKGIKTKGRALACVKGTVLLTHFHFKNQG